MLLCTMRIVLGCDIAEVVARDGIEPPTPAFSGPRSTTELSGLPLGEEIADALAPQPRFEVTCLDREAIGRTAMLQRAFRNDSVEYNNDPLRRQRRGWGSRSRSMLGLPHPDP